MFKVTCNFLKHAKTSSSVQGYLRLNNFTSVPVTATSQSVENQEALAKSKAVQATVAKSVQNQKGHLSIVDAAFSILKEDELSSDIKTPFTDSRISNATTVDELLVIPEGVGVSRKLALRIIAVLSDWATSGKADMKQFESDPRFIRLCKVLTRGSAIKVGRGNGPHLRKDDISTILGLTAEEDAAKLMSSLTMPHMVKAMSFLALKRHRSLTLLRTLAYSISGKAEHLNMKLCSDVLYSSAILNYIDENLLDKACRDIFLAMQSQYDRSPVIGSILTSLGFLRYKNPAILDVLSEWSLKHYVKCRSQDLFALFITLAILNHEPINSKDLYKVLIPQLNESDAIKAPMWLDVVWSLVVLNQATEKHISSVLSDSFLDKLKADMKHSNGIKLKLLSIDSACDLLIDNYKGPRLPKSSNLKTVKLIPTKEKENMVIMMQDSLSSLVNVSTHMNINVATEMGFNIDAEIKLDNKCNPLPLDSNTGTKVAVLTHDFHDMCHGRVEPTGFNALNTRLLEAQGYKVLVIPYTEFSSSDKYVNRVKYIESRLKALPLN